MRYVAEAGRTTRWSTLLGAAVLTAAALSLSGCEVTETSGNYSAGPMCPANYNPVCAERRGEERTFPNACQARQSDWRIVSSGQCSAGDYRNDRRDRDGWSRDYRDSSGAPDDWRGRDRNRDGNQTRRDRDRPDRSLSQPSCPQVNDPVCGQLGNNALIFPNRCEMLRSGATEARPRLCRG